MSVRSTAVHLIRRPTGEPVVEDFALISTEIEPGPGDLLVRNSAMSVEPYMRGRMSEQASYVAPYELNSPMSGHAVGEVVESTVAEIPVGTSVLHEYGWRDYALVPSAEATIIDTREFPATSYLGVLGQTGMTAWVGLRVIADVQSGDTVFISSAAGAVGSVAGQIAKALGARTVGSCGSARKVAEITGKQGYDVAFDYHEGPVREQLGKALADLGEDGIDVYFDNVGGEHLEAAVRRMRDFGRIALCGAISVYNSPTPVPGPRNLLLLIWHRVSMAGFLVGDHANRHGEFTVAMQQWLREGLVSDPQTAVGSGIDQAVDGFLSMLRGGTTGKAIVSL